MSPSRFPMIAPNRLVFSAVALTGVLVLAAVLDAGAASLGAPHAETRAKVKVEMTRSEKESAIPCPKPRKYADMEACETKREKEGYKDLPLSDGNVFLVVSFSGATDRVMIEFKRPAFKLTLEGGKVLEAVAARVQANKLGDKGRIPYPERTRFKRNVYSTSYLPMKGEPPFAIVFQVPKSARRGSLSTPDSSNQALRW